MPKTDHRYLTSVNVRLTPAQRAKIQKQAQAEGLNLSEYIRKSLDDRSTVTLNLNNADHLRLLGKMIVDAVNDVWERK